VFCDQLQVVPQGGHTGQTQGPQGPLGKPNPFRSLGDALEHWRAKLNVTEDQPENEGQVSKLHITDFAVLSGVQAGTSFVPHAPAVSVQAVFGTVISLYMQQVPLYN
jgi:hypothetical protein